jgi:mRNA interferase RelE/StbE
LAKYRLVFKKSVVKDFTSIPTTHVSRILSRIEDLANDPRPQGSAKLAGQERYRIRHGAYRILYEITDTELVITVVRVRHRKDAYG